MAGCRGRARDWSRGSDGGCWLSRTKQWAAQGSRYGLEPGELLLSRESEGLLEACAQE